MITIISYHKLSSGFCHEYSVGAYTFWVFILWCIIFTKPYYIILIANILTVIAIYKQSIRYLRRIQRCLSTKVNNFKIFSIDNVQYSRDYYLLLAVHGKFGVVAGTKFVAAQGSPMAPGYSGNISRLCVVQAAGQARATGDKSSGPRSRLMSASILSAFRQTLLALKKFGDCISKCYMVTSSFIF